MKKTFRFLVLIATSLFGVSSMAANQDAAMRLAQQCLNGNVKLVTNRLKAYNPDPAYYLWQGEEGKGFCLTSSDDEPFVLGYSATSSLSYDEMPEALAAVLANYEKVARAGVVVERTEKQTPSVRGLKTTAGRTPIASLLGDIKYGQRFPYNNQCPKSDGKACLTGCVNTALAQIFKYYNYPAATTAEIPAYKTKTLGLVVPSVPKGTTFDWENMLENYDAFYPNSPVESAVAKLHAVLGTAMQSDYTLNATGTYDNGALVNVMTTYFGYDRDNIMQLNRGDFDLKFFEDAVYYELQCKRPVYLSGASSGGAHAFVCDGADQWGLFHINWGWTGSCNGYFDMAFLDPYAYDEAGASSSADGYSGNLLALIGLYPENNVKDESLPALISCNNYVVESNFEVGMYTSTLEGTATVSVFDSKENALYAIAMLNDNNEFELVGEKKLCPNSPTIEEYDMTYSLPSGQKEANVFFYLVKSYDGGASWQPANNFRTSRFYYYFKLSDNILFPFWSKQEQAVLKGDIVCWVENGGKYVQVKLTNTGDMEYYELITIYSRDKEVAKTYATVPAGGSTLLTFQYSNNTNKYEYNIIKVTDFRGNVIVNKKEVFGNGVDNVDADKLSISSLNGALQIMSSADVKLVVYNAEGQIVAMKQMSSFSPEVIALPAGVYFVNGRKAIVY